MHKKNQLSAPIRFYNRYSDAIEMESVYGEKFLRWAYGNPLGQLTVALAVKRFWFSRWYGWRMDQPGSRKKIQAFIQEYAVNVNEFAAQSDEYRSFNDFFYRRLKPSARPIAGNETVAVFPADGRHLAIQDVSAADTFYIKGQQFNLEVFLGSKDLANEFEGGALLISRLCPVDYHRFHFPVAGMPQPAYMLGSSLRSVSPLALRRKLAILWENRRSLTEVDSKIFGKVIIVEIGATCVGGIHQTYKAGQFVQKGDEKGYFSFGGSCVATLYRKGAIRFDDDLLEHAAQGTEVYVKMGDRCGTSGITRQRADNV